MMKQSAEKTTSKNAVKTVIPSIWRTAGGKYSLIMLAIWLVVSAISLVWTPYSLLDTDGFNTWASPSGAHMLGTDGVGADVLSWLMAGSRTNLAIALLTVVVAALEPPSPLPLLAPKTPLAPTPEPKPLPDPDEPKIPEPEAAELKVPAADTPLRVDELLAPIPLPKAPAWPN